MNPDLNTSPMTSAQSWIVENISSLISSNHDDENDCTLTLSNETATQKPKSLPPSSSCELEVERSRTVVGDCLQAERIPKRPFSPETITDNSRQNEQMHTFYNNALFNQNSQQLVSYFLSSAKTRSCQNSSKKIFRNKFGPSFFSVNFSNVKRE